MNEITTYDDVVYTIVEQKYAYVGRGYSTPPYTSAVPTDYSLPMSIPSFIEYNNKKYPVKIVGRHAFYNCTAITLVTVPFTCEILEWSCFGAMVSLKQIIFEQGIQLQYIEDDCMHSCGNLTSILLPSSVISVSNIAFRFRETPIKVYYCGKADLSNLKHIILIRSFNEKQCINENTRCVSCTSYVPKSVYLIYILID